MQTHPSHIICEHCDTVYLRPSLDAGETAFCERCTAPLYARGRLSIESWFALSIATAVAFIVANVYPAVHIGFQGLSNEATLWQAVSALWVGPIAAIAIPAAVVAVFIPFLQIVLLLWVLGYARHGHRSPGFATCMRLLVMIRPWSMVEVATLGVLVAMVKLHGTLSVHALPGAWAMGLSMLGLTLVANRNISRLWDLTEPAPLAIHQALR